MLKRNETLSDRRRPAQPTQPGPPGMSWLRRLGLLLFLVLGAALAANMLVLAPTAKVSPINGSSAYLRPLSAYETTVDKILRSSLWNRTKPTLNTGDIKNQLLRQFPELTDVSIVTPLFAHQAVVYVEPVQPALLLNTNSGSFIIATSGKALLRVDNPASAPKSLPVLTDQSGLNVQVGHQVLPASYISFIKGLITELSARQYAVSSMNLPPASNELDVHLAGQNYYVKFNLANNDPREQAGTFLATLAMLKKQNITPAQYVDVRVDGRAYYQ